MVNPYGIDQVVPSQSHTQYQHTHSVQSRGETPPQPAFAGPFTEVSTTSRFTASKTGEGVAWFDPALSSEAKVDLQPEREHE